jgi:acyl carrier protein
MNNIDNVETIRAVLAEEIGFQAHEVGGGTNIADTLEWDSLAHLRIILRIEEIIGRTLESTELLQLTNYTSICDFFSKLDVKRYKDNE